MNITAKIIDLHHACIYPAQIQMKEGKIKSITRLASVPEDAGYILPGFTDAHVHVESSMLPPTEFARMAVVHGTVGSVSDPHEITNVLGSAGVHYMLEEAGQTPFSFYRH